jgi:hypothetical protein
LIDTLLRGANPEPPLSPPPQAAMISTATQPSLKKTPRLARFITHCPH